MRRQRICSRLLFMSLAFWVVSGPTSLGATPSFVLQNPLERPCPTETIVIEAPTWADPFPPGFEARLANSLATVGQSWYCRSCRPVEFVVTPVLPDYSDPVRYPDLPSTRRDGHRRFFTLTARRRGTTEALAIVDGQACAAISRIRSEVALAINKTSPTSHSPQPEFLVSRECPLAILDFEAHLSSSTVRWAFERIESTGAPHSTVDIALVDSGVPAHLRLGVGVVDEAAFLGDASGNYHPHGTHMAAAISKIAPNAKIHSYRALDSDGVGAVTDVAAALDAVLLDAANGEVDVVNLSLGFVPHMTLPNDLNGQGSCTTWEDGLGESLRYTIFNLNHLDASGGPLLVAAGGNSLLEQQEVLRAGRVAPSTRCNTPAGPTGSSAFLPAGFGKQAACVGAGGSWSASPLSVLDVGATTYGDARSAVNVNAVEPLVQAPGEEVYIQYNGGQPTPMSLSCDPTDLGAEQGWTSPATVTGTSISAALVTGAAAHIAAANIGVTDPYVWARLLYVTGEYVCVPDVENLQVTPTPKRPTDTRRLNVRRLLRVLDPVYRTACQPLIDCVMQPHSGAFIDTSLPTACGIQLQHCLGGDDASLSCDMRRHVRPPPQSSYDASLASNQCAATWATAGHSTVVTRISDWSDTEDVQAGGFRPLPLGVGCGHCRMHAARTPGSGALAVTASGELTDTLPGTVTFSNGHVTMLRSDGTFDRSFPLNAPALALSGGRHFSVDIGSGLTATQADELEAILIVGGSATLHMTLTAGTRTAHVLSPLEWTRP